MVLILIKFQLGNHSFHLQMSKYSKLLSDTAIFGIGNFITKLIYFFLMPIYTLALNAYDFGIADLLNNSLQIIIPIFTLCISDAVFRFSLDDDARPESIIANGVKIINYSFLVVSIAVGIIYLITGHLYWILLGVLYFVEATKSVFAQFTRGLGLVKIYAYNGIIAAVVLLATTYLFLRTIPLGINGYLSAFILANVASILYLLVRTKILCYLKQFSFDRVLLRCMLIFSLPLVPNMLSWWLTNISSRYIIALFCGISDSGYYSAASKLPALINVLSSIFQLSWQYASVKEYKESRKSEFYSVVFRFYSSVIIVFGSIIISAIPYISKFILKGNFYDAWVYTPLLMFSAVLGCYSIFFGTFYAVVKDNKKAMYTTLAGSAANVILCFCLIPIIGILGALIANVVSYVIIVVMRVHDCIEYIQLNVNWRKNIFSLLLLLIESILLTIENRITFVTALIMPVVFCIVYKYRIAQLVLFLKNTALKRK